MQPPGGKFNERSFMQIKETKTGKISTQQWSAKWENYHPEQMEAGSRDSHT